MSEQTPAQQAERLEQMAKSVRYKRHPAAHIWQGEIDALEAGAAALRHCADAAEQQEKARRDAPAQEAWTCQCGATTAAIDDFCWSCKTRRPSPSPGDGIAQANEATNIEAAQDKLTLAVNAYRDATGENLLTAAIRASLAAITWCHAGEARTAEASLTTEAQARTVEEAK